MKKSLLQITMIIAVILLFCFTFSCQQGEEVAEEVANGERLPIIDVHVHSHSAWQGEKPDWFPKDVYLPKTDEEFTKMTFEMFERCNIVRAVVSGDPLWVDKWRKTSPIKIIPGWANYIVGNSQEDFDSLKNKIIDGQIEVIGEIGAQYMGLAPNDSLLEPYYAMAEELNVPFGIHVGPAPPGSSVDYISPKYRIRKGKPLLLEDVLVQHPKLRVYVMHAGWPFLEEMVALMFLYPNVYVDIGGSWLVPRDEFHFILRRLIQAGFGKRIMFGSDQMFWPDAIELAIESVESANFLTEEQERDIFYNNAKRFFRLE